LKTPIIKEQKISYLQKDTHKNQYNIHLLIYYTIAKPSTIESDEVNLLMVIKKQNDSYLANFLAK